MGTHRVNARCQSAEPDICMSGDASDFIRGRMSHVMCFSVRQKPSGVTETTSSYHRQALPQESLHDRFADPLSAAGDYGHHPIVCHETSLPGCARMRLSNCLGPIQTLAHTFFRPVKRDTPNSLVSPPAIGLVIVVAVRSRISPYPASSRARRKAARSNP